MNKSRTQSIYTSDQPNVRTPVFNTGDSPGHSHSVNFYELVREKFIQQSVRYMRSNIN